jgi:hypothetical protein
VAPAAESSVREQILMDECDLPLVEVVVPDQLALGAGTVRRTV